jgi:hypothetical protein
VSDAVASALADLPDAAALAAMRVRVEAGCDVCMLIPDGLRGRVLAVLRDPAGRAWEAARLPYTLCRYYYRADRGEWAAAVDARAVQWDAVRSWLCHPGPKSADATWWPTFPPGPPGKSPGDDLLPEKEPTLRYGYQSAPERGPVGWATPRGPADWPLRFQFPGHHATDEPTTGELGYGYDRPGGAGSPVAQVPLGWARPAARAAALTAVAFRPTPTAPDLRRFPSARHAHDAAQAAATRAAGKPLPLGGVVGEVARAAALSLDLGEAVDRVAVVALPVGAADAPDPAAASPARWVIQWWGFPTPNTVPAWGVSLAEVVPAAPAGSGR